MACRICRLSTLGISPAVPSHQETRHNGHWRLQEMQFSSSAASSTPRQHVLRANERYAHLVAVLGSLLIVRHVSYGNAIGKTALGSWRRWHDILQQLQARQFPETDQLPETRKLGTRKKSFADRCSFVCTFVTKSKPRRLISGHFSSAGGSNNSRVFLSCTRTAGERSQTGPFS